MRATAAKITGVVIAALVAAFIATTWWALESGGVAVIETQTAGGEVRSTHVWFVEPNGELWLEAGAPANPWFLDIQENPLLTFRAGEHVARYTAQPIDRAAARARIRSLLREKYGLRDLWVGLLVDTSRSVAVRLTPHPEFPALPARYPSAAALARRREAPWRCSSRTSHPPSSCRAPSASTCPC